MGCNTSQELKTKDSVVTLNGDEGGTGGDSGAGGMRDSANSNAADHHNHHNGNIAGHSAKSTHHSKGSALTAGPGGDASSSSAKHSAGSGGAFTYSGGPSGAPSDKERQCEKADLTEFNDIELGEDEAKAATKIQAVFRGHQVRSTMKKSEAGATDKSADKNGAATAPPSAGAAAAAAAHEAEPTREELEAEFDPNDKELCDAALKIQAAFRGHLTRKTVTKEDDVDIQEITKKVAEELDIDLTDPELNKAATKIQASFRGHKIRKDVPATSQ